MCEIYFWACVYGARFNLSVNYRLIVQSFRFDHNSTYQNALRVRVALSRSISLPYIYRLRRSIPLRNRSFYFITKIGLFPTRRMDECNFSESQQDETHLGDYIAISHYNNPRPYSNPKLVWSGFFLSRYFLDSSIWDSTRKLTLPDAVMKIIYGSPNSVHRPNISNLWPPLAYGIVVIKIWYYCII